MFYSSLIILFIGCKTNPSPKQQLEKFIFALRHLDFEKAETLVTDDSKMAFVSFKNEYKKSYDFQSEFKHQNTITQEYIAKSYEFDSLDESINEKNALVMKRTYLGVSFEKVVFEKEKVL